MIEKQILIDDLNNICEHTNAQWVCSQDFYTLNISEDETKFCKFFQDAGYNTKKDLVATKHAYMEYGGGLRFKYEDVISGGHVISVSEKYKAPLIISGFDTHFDQMTIYHECAHLYQRKHNFFEQKAGRDYEYKKYLKEVHANTFATMVLLLRAKDILSFKQQQQYCLAHDVQTYNRNSKNSKYYISLPIVLNLLKAVKKEGRANTLRKFSKKGKLDFEKIAFFTADFVNMYAYKPLEFYKISHNATFEYHEMMKRKAKAWRMLGEKYIIAENKKLQKRKSDYTYIREQRYSQTNQKIKKLPEIDEKAKVINAVCAIDVLNTRLNQDFDIYTNLDNLVSGQVYFFHNIQDKGKRQEAAKICEEMAQIHKQWRKNHYYKKLFLKINHPDTRDKVWSIKFKKEREIVQNFQVTKQY